MHFKLVRELLAFVMAIVEIMLAIRFILRMFAADAHAGFVEWIYTNTQPLLKPFLFAFPTPSVKGGFVFEFTTLFALFAYAFVGYLVEQLLEIIDK